MMRVSKDIVELETGPDKIEINMHHIRKWK
jgi:hypothetical protein